MSGDRTPPPSRPPLSPQSRRTLWIAIMVVLAGIGIGVLLVAAMLPKWLQSGGGKPAVTETGSTVESRKIHATLFYLSDDGSQLVPVSEEVPFGATPAEQARRVVEAQVKAAPKGQTSVIPAGTTVRGLFLTNRGDAYVDLSPEIVSGHPGGSLAETLTVFAIVDALTINLPDISAVQILVNGKEVDTLAGHVDLRHPLGKSLKWIKR